MHPDGSLGLALRPLRPGDIHRHPKYLFQHLPQAGLSCYCASNPLMISFVGSESGVWGGIQLSPMDRPITIFRMRIYFCALLLCLNSITAISAEKWKLVWSDEFNGKQLDYSKWGVKENAFGGGNHELQIYTDRKKNIRVENGRLIIEAHKDNAQIAGTQRQFSSGSIRTKHRGDWCYGKFEIRAKLPAGQGLWPAIWMLPTNDVFGSWAASGEIDIMEFRGHEPNTYHGTLHFGGLWPNNRQSTGKLKLAEGNFTDVFRTFGIEWEAGEIRWYLDGKLWQTKKKWDTVGGKFPAPFTEQFHLVLNLAVGGKFPGNPNAQTSFPSKMEVDWVRVYQRK